MNEIEHAAAGWYRDPACAGQVRWWNGKEWTTFVCSSTRALPHDKSVGVAFVLTLFFGPLGLFYVSAPIALVALAVSFVVFVLTLGSSFILTWLAVIILGCIIASRRHAEYQAWLVRHLPPPRDPLATAWSPWPASEQRWSTAAMEPHVALGSSQSAAEVNGPPGWRPDPSGRFEVRWWNGSAWTSHVMNGGYRVTDPFGADLSAKSPN